MERKRGADVVADKLRLFRLAAHTVTDRGRNGAAPVYAHAP